MRITSICAVFSLATTAYANPPEGWVAPANCIRSATTGANGAYYDSWVYETGEICHEVDCGGGRGRPNDSQPGCPFYTGTEVYVQTKKYLAGTPWVNGPPGAAATTTAPAPQKPAETPAVTTSAPTPTIAPVAEEDKPPNVSEPALAPAPVTSEKAENGITWTSTDSIITIQTETSVITSALAKVTVSSAKSFVTSASSVELNEASKTVGNASKTDSASAQSSVFTGAASGITWSTPVIGAMAFLAAFAI